MARFKGRKIDNATKKRGRDALNRSFNTSYPEEGLNNPITEEDLAIKVHNFANMFINKRKSDPSKYLLFSVNAEGNTLVINLRISNHYSNSSFTLMKANEKITVDKRYSLYFKIGGVDDIVSPKDNISDTKDGTQNILYEIDGAHLYNMADVNLLKNAVQELLMKGTFRLPFKKSTAIVPYGFWGKVNEQVRHTIRRIIKENKQYNTMKHTIRLTECDLRKMVKQLIRETYDMINGQTEGDISGEYKIKYIDSDDDYETGYWREETVFIDMSEEDGYRIRMNGYSTEEFLGMAENLVLHYVYEGLKKGMTVQEALQEIMENSQTADGIVPSNYNIDESIRRTIRKVLR